MGYLNNTQVTVDAILTKKGRELLAKGLGSFKITQFALADDEIDYRLWNPNHPLGSEYYGEAIENMPLVEATPDETQIMKYKLVTLNKSTTRIPVISVAGATNLTFTTNGQSQIITPQTINYDNGNATFGYTAILSDSTVALLEPTGTQVNFSGLPTFPQFVTDGSSESITAIGFKFKITAKGQALADKTATLTIIGNETGGRISMNIIVKKQTIIQIPDIQQGFESVGTSVL
jgi:hypothetical protein